jgi:hypothetical protein
MPGRTTANPLASADAAEANTRRLVVEQEHVAGLKPARKDEIASNIARQAGRPAEAVDHAVRGHDGGGIPPR